MAKVLAVFGATGQQGGSVVHSVLNDPELSKTYTVRAITHNINSEASRTLRQTMDVVHGDTSDQASLEAALHGVHTAFVMTNPLFTPDGLEIEYRAGKAIADAAVANGAQYIIFSTLPSPKKISGGKYSGISHFEAKVEIEKYIRSLKIKSAFVSLGYFMQNFQNMPHLGPQKAPDGTWAIVLPNVPTTKWPMVDVAGDTGKFVGAILAEPEKYEGKTFCASTAFSSMDEIAAAISKATGKKVVYKQSPLEVWKNRLPFGGDELAEQFTYEEEFGYYGKDGKEKVEWAVENVRGRPSTLEEFFKQNPLKLE